MKHAWTKLVAIATLVAIVTTAPVGAVEVQVRPDKNLTGGSVQDRRSRMRRAGTPDRNRHPMRCARTGRSTETIRITSRTRILITRSTT